MEVIKKNVTNDIDEEKNKSEIDYLEATIGSIGIWQLCIWVAASFSRYVAIGNIMFIVFLTPATEFICTEFKNNITMAAQKMTCYESCVKYEYNSSAMDQTIISDFELICDRHWLASFAQTALMFGVVIGVSFFGWLSDRLGRRVALITSIILNLLSMVPSAFSPNYWVYISLRLITGIATGGSLILCFPIIVEISSKKYRGMAASLAFFPDCISEISLAILAYYLPTWKSLTLGFSLLCVFILFLVFVVPESPRWLLSKGKTEEAICVLTKAAKWNNLSTDHIRETVTKNVGTLRIKEKDDSTCSDIFTQSFIKITLATSLIWTLLGTMFFGLYQYMALLAANVYLTVIMIALVQMLLCGIQMYLTNNFNRKSTMIGSLIISGTALLILIFTPKGHWSSSMIGILGFSACCISFSIAYVYNGELYPTPLRGMALGLVSAASKAGAMASPFIANLSPVWIPSLIFATMAFVAAAFCFFLPETKGRDLKDTLD